MQNKLQMWLVSSLAVLGVSLTGGAAYAGDQPLYQPAPDWVRPAPRPVASKESDSLQAVIMDNQLRIQGPQVWSYGEQAQRVTSADALNRMGSISLRWSPDHGDLIIHGVDIVRDGQTIDVLAGGAKFTVLRREANLESLMLDGQLTATLAVEGLRVGDILDLRYSTTSTDNALQGNAATAAPFMVEPLRVGYGRVRALWPGDAPIKWRLYSTGAATHESSAGKWHEFEFNFPLAKQPDLAPGAPGRYAKPPIVEFSSFADWQSVSKIMAPLYATKGLIEPGSPLAQEVAKIAAASPDPRQRTLLALQMVQDKVRYFLKAMDGGNYVPQAPAQTWANRYGDCKAKTLLLLSILHELGIDAEPALANLHNGDLISVRLPSIASFDHVFVLAHINGETLWLDGTSLGAVREDLDNVPPFYWVLPVTAQGSDLYKVPNKYPTRPMSDMTFSIDLRAGIELPSPVEARMVYHGPMAGNLNTNLSRLDKDGREKMLLSAMGTMPIFEISTVPTFEYDEATATAVISITGIGRQGWVHADQRYSIDPVGASVPPPPDRSRAIWKDIPVYAPPVANYEAKSIMLLPDHGKAFSLEGPLARDWELAGNRRIGYTAKLANGELVTTLKQAQAGGEYTAADIPELRKKVAEIASHGLKLRTVADYPATWLGVERAKREHLFDRTFKIFEEAIAAKPDEARRYLLRASFYSMIFEREKAIADLDKALALQADKQTYRQRAEMYRELGKYDLSIADLKAAAELDPGDNDLVASLARMEIITGQADSGQTRMDAAIDNAGNDAPILLGDKAEMTFIAGNRDEALDLINSAIEKRPANASLLNTRCWLRGIGNVELDAAVKDCSRAMELGDSVAAAALDSRAMVYFRLNRYADAMTDLQAALDANPAQAGSLFMRAIVERKLGQAGKGEQDVAGARLLDPRVDEEYARYGIHW